MPSFYGKYRGKVANNVDPTGQGRIQVSVPAVLGTDGLSWAMPCVPYAGPGVGFFALPPNGANIWVEFEGGSPDWPIWAGCYWGLGELPAEAALPTQKLIKTDGLLLLLDDTPGGGGITIKADDPAVALPVSIQLSNGITLSGTPASVQVAPESIQISLGAASINLSPASVNINNGALEII